MKATSAVDVTTLQDIPNIGPAIEQKLAQINILHPQDLLGTDPAALYRELCKISNKRYDPCLLDVFMAAVDFMEGAPARQWWFYTKKRKEKYLNL